MTGQLAKNLEQIRKRIEKAVSRVHRDAQEITLIAVSKQKSVDLIRAAYELGQQDFGENYAQELKEKASLLSDLPIEWHFIGHLQQNKVKTIAPIAASTTIDSFRAAEAMNDRRKTPIDIFLEINIGNESSKSGMTPKETPELLHQLESLKQLRIKGLMCIPPYTLNPEGNRPYFRQMHELADKLGIKELSMGMSHDFEIAIEEGATILRIGSAIFGDRV